VTRPPDGDGRAPRASEQDGSYPRPQLVRRTWTDLCGQWAFRFDDADEGVSARWQTHPSFPEAITVPFPPESAASGIGDTGFHPVVWYHREISRAQLENAGFGAGTRLMLRFGAVDYRCSVWLDGQLLGRHEGGHTPFGFDATDALGPAESHTLVVRAEDDPHDLSQPRGKQDWQREPHDIWYHRTTGIWQPVWLEAVPELSIQHLAWRTDAAGTVQLAATLSRQPPVGSTMTVALSHDGQELTHLVMTVTALDARATLHLPERARNGGRLLWSPSHPALIDAAVTVSDGLSVDTVGSYFGLRSVGTARGRLMLNGHPLYLRSVLSQGYWPQSHLASPSANALRAEVQLIKDLGFNAARIHQKVEDPRFLFWADKLGLAVWAEAPNAYEFSPVAVRRLLGEWVEAVQRDASHPCILAWVPLNESWGVPAIATDTAMRDYCLALYHLTKSLDPTRPVISNDGWEQPDSDLWTVHDYEAAAPVVEARYRDAEARNRLFDGLGPAGRVLRLSDNADRGQPVMLTEFGGIRFAPDADGTSTWGYSSARSAEDFAERLSGLVAAVRSSQFLAGFCYTQLTDTLQEANGLLTEDREPKIPIGRLRDIFTGQAPPAS
jgi:beta-galactosidase/beta-glucuronidase